MLSSLAAGHVASRIWRREPAVFVGQSAPPAVADAIRHRLGWLDAPAAINGHLVTLEQFVAGVRADGLTEAVLLGMGGSSLCAEVLRDVPSARRDGCRLTVLDTTDERAIRAVTERLDPTRTLFLVASKSGSTIEVTSLEQHFWQRMGSGSGRHFVAITDPETSLETLARQRGYRHTFINPPDIGGRYSALSLFGLVPAALLGLDPGALEQSAVEMARQCEADDVANPGLALGAFMATHAASGRDKLTLLCSSEMDPFGAWAEQLVAESTGKEARGVLPVVGEPFGRVDEYGTDRAFVVIASGRGDAVTLGNALERAGHPVFRIGAGPNDLGAEFFRWEFATAVAGAALALNPFDEPNVRDAKTRTAAQLASKSAHGAFRIEPPFVKGEGYSRRESRATHGAGGRRRYIAILDYLPADGRRQRLMSDLRATLRRRTGLATTHGIGPRYLHSTGQFHKGGPNTGIFVLLTATDASATPVPGTDYTFSTLKQAQALGDFEALTANGRDVVHYHLDDPRADFGDTLERLLGKLDATA